MEWNGSSWAAITSLVGALVYSFKRDEYLTLLDTSANTITPFLFPESVSSATALLKFWLPNSLVDTFYMSEKGKVASKTVDSASWATTMYARYIVKSSDTQYSSYTNFIATYVADINTHTGKWIFQPAKEGDSVYIDDVNAFYYFDGTSWLVLAPGGSGGPVGTLYAAEGRQGVAGLDDTVLTASVVDTYQKIAFAYSVISDTSICPLSFFTAAGTDFTLPRSGVYAIGYGGFYVTYANPLQPPDSITLAVKVNGTVIHSFTLPHLDDFEGEAFHGLKKMSASDVVTFEFKTTGTYYNTQFTIHGFHAYVYTVDGGAGALTPHALGEHTDTVFGTPNVNDVVYWDGTKYVIGPVVASASPHLIIGSSHSDSQANGSITDGQFLKRVSGKWKNWTLVLSDVSNVILSTPSNGQVLGFNGTNWVNTSISAALRFDDLLDVNPGMAGKVNGSVPRWNSTTSRYTAWLPVLSGLADVNTAGAVSGNGLVFNGSQWVPGTPTATVAFAGGTYEYISGTSWSVYGGVEVNCSVSGFAFVAGISGYWQAVVTVAPLVPGGSPDSSGTFQWYVGASAVGASFGTGTAGNVALQTFSATFGLGAGSVMALGIDPTKMKYVKATFTRVGG